MNDESTATVPAAEETPRTKKRTLRRVLIGIAIVLGVIVVAGAALYSFGTMMPPSTEARSAYDAEVAAGQMPAVGARFGIPVPGCVCHSDDPLLQIPHSTRYIRECRNCHSRR